jgi:hypothetical protein
VVVTTTEEILFETTQSNVSELLGARMSISNATINISKEDEPEENFMRREFEHLQH